MPATRMWDIDFDRESDDLNTSLSPDEIHIKDNEVEFIGGRGKTKSIRLKKPVEELVLDNISVKRHLAEFSNDVWKILGARPVVSY